MTRLWNCGIIIDIPEEYISSYIRDGYTRMDEPVEIPAPEVEQELPPEKAAKPEKVMEPVKKPANKTGKKVV